jgi:hypothetical protein
VVRRYALVAVILILLTPGRADAQVPIGPLTFTGYVQPDALLNLSDEPFGHEDTVRIRRARFTLLGKLSDRIGWEVSAELTASPTVRDAFVAFRLAPWAQVRAGQFVTPFSLERLTSTSRLELIDRVLDTLTPSRDAGVEVGSVKPIGGWLTYGFAVINGTRQNQADNNAAKDVVGRFASPLPGVKFVTVGVNLATGEQPDGRRDRYGADVEFRAGGTKVVGEFVHESHETLAGSDGFYVMAAHRWGAAELAGRVSRGEFGEADRRRRVEVGGNYYFGSRTRLMVHLVVEPDLPGSAMGLITRMQFGF